MIKIIAVITMLLDHIGVILIPLNDPKLYALRTFLRIFGRLSMPIFAYCIARGFYYSEQKGTTYKYFKNIIIFSACSQVVFSLTPYLLREYLEDSWEWRGINLNIGFTWLFSLILLKSLSYIKNPLDKKGLAAILIFIATIIASWFINVDYGIYGVLFPLVFYFCMFKINSPLLCLIFTIFLNIFYSIKHKKPIFGIENTQMLTTLTIFFIPWLDKYDRKIKLPKWFFYWFYPVHLALLGAIRYLIEQLKVF